MTADVGERFAAPEYKRLLDAARRSLELTGGDLSRNVTVKTPDDKERRAIIAITGRYRDEGVSALSVGLAELDAAIAEATGTGLRQFLERIGPPLQDRPADELRVVGGSEAAVRSVKEIFPNEPSWLRPWLAELGTDGTLTKLVTFGETDRLRLAARVLSWLEKRIEIKAAPTQLGELAATITGDSKALNQGTALGTLVLRALAFRQGIARPRTTEQRRDLWDQCGIIVDDLASRVLVLNLPAAGAALGEWLTAAADYGMPFYVTLQQLVTFGIAIAEPVVFGCENPAVLRRAAADLGSASPPLVCTEGQPSTAFHRLAAAVSRGGGEIRYHGDFDWPGIAITTGLIERHNAIPWRMTAADYSACLGSHDRTPLAGAPQPTPWDPELGHAMQSAGRAVHEEPLAARLIADLRALRLPSSRVSQRSTRCTAR